MKAKRLLEQAFNGCCKQLRKTPNMDTSEALKLVKAVARGNAYFAYETFFPIQDEMMGAPTTSEMLLRTDREDIDKQTAFQQIRDAGISCGFDLLVCGLAIRQSLEDQVGSISVNADITSLSSLEFILSLYELQQDKDFNIAKENLTIEAFEGHVQKHQKFTHLNQVQIALDDIDPINHFERDTNRMRAFHESGANITIIKLDGALCQTATNVIGNLNKSTKIIQQYFPNTPILLEQIQTPQEAARLKGLGISYVQGYKLPEDTIEQIKQYEAPKLAVA